jgi:conjugative relaxase-like TrwC/TraI family protein
VDCRKFEHDTVRPVDGYPAPQLHTHVIVFNMTEDALGFAHSLQPYELFRVQSMAIAVYHNVLEHDLRALVYQIERGKNHAPEIKGSPLNISKARASARHRFARCAKPKGLCGAEAASIAAHAGREEKLNLSPSELKKLDQTHAVEFGNQPSQVVAESCPPSAARTPGRKDNGEGDRSRRVRPRAAQRTVSGSRTF